MCVSRLSRILLGAWRNNNNSSMNIPLYYIKVMYFTPSVLEAGVRKSHRKGLTRKKHKSMWMESWVKATHWHRILKTGTEPRVTMVTGLSTGWKGESWSSESARSTTTPGWTHWVRRWWRVSHGCVCVCVWEEIVGVCVHCNLPWRRLMQKWVLQRVLTHVVDVGDVVFVDSNCLW